MKYRRGLLVLAVLAALTPLGILAQGGAWGEWSLQEIRAIIGYEPRGMSRFEASGAPFPDYTLPGMARTPLNESIATMLSAVIGAGITALTAWAIARIAKKWQDFSKKI